MKGLQMIQSQGDLLSSNQSKSPTKEAYSPVGGYDGQEVKYQVNKKNTAKKIVKIIIMIFLTISFVVFLNLFSKYTKSYSHHFDISIEQMIKDASLSNIVSNEFNTKNGILKSQFFNAIELLEVTDNVEFNGSIRVNMTDNEWSETRKIKRIKKLLERDSRYLEEKYKIRDYQKNMQLPFCIVVVAYQNLAQGLYERNLKSIFMQNYTNYRVVYVDDASPDRTGEYIPCFLPQNSIPKNKIQILSNEKRKRALQTIYEVINNNCQLGEIAMIIEADDSLIGTNVLSVYNAIYQRDKCAMAYSSQLTVQNNKNIEFQMAKEIPEDIFLSMKIRELQQMPPQHLLSFYVDVFRSVQKNHFLNSDKEFFSHAYETALIVPLLQISYPRISLVKEALYENRLQHGEEQNSSEIEKQIKEILSKKAYSPLKFFPFIERAKYKYFFDVEIEKVIQDSDFSHYKAENNFTHEGFTKEMHIRAIRMTQIIHNVNFHGQIVVEMAEYETSKPEKQQRIRKLLEEDRKYYNQKYQIDHYQKNYELPFCIVTTCYNNVKNGLYLRNLDSIFMQDYKNYHIVYVDDASPQKTGQHVAQYIENKKIPKQKIEIIINKENKRALTNIYYAIQKCKDGEIVVLIDGDDSFIGRNILPLFNAIYQKQKVAIAYSNFLTIHNNDRTGLGFCHPPNEEKLKTNKFREEWNLVGTHLMTFYSDLFRKIKIEDLKYENGTFLYFAYDRAILTPMLEMAYPRIRVVKELTYEYRNDTGSNQATDDWSKDSRIVLDKPAYKHLEDFSFIFGISESENQQNQTETVLIEEQGRKKISSKHQAIILNDDTDVDKMAIFEPEKKIF